MLGVAFDTLKLARKFESAGFPTKQAQDASAAIAESVSEWHASINLATREDMMRLEDRLNTRFAEVDKHIADKASETIKWIVGMAIAMIGLMVTILSLVSRLHG